MARLIKRAVVVVAVALGPLVAAVPAHAFYVDNHNQALVEDEG